MLLTGDKRLRRAAEVEGFRVHGVLWVIDQLHQAGVCCAAQLIAALERWRDDPAVFLPERETQVRLQRLRCRLDRLCEARMQSRFAAGV